MLIGSIYFAVCNELSILLLYLLAGILKKVRESTRSLFVGCHCICDYAFVNIFVKFCLINELFIKA